MIDRLLLIERPDIITVQYGIRKAENTNNGTTKAFHKARETFFFATEVLIILLYTS